MKANFVTVVALVLILTSAAGAAPEFKISAVGGNSCGFWGAGFLATDSHPVADQNSFTDLVHPATFRYAASSGCGQLFLHTEVDWFCNCGSLCGENNGLARMTLDDVVFTGPPGATTVSYRFSLDLTVPILASGGGWRLRANVHTWAQIDTGEQSGILPITRFVSSLDTVNVNQPVQFDILLTTRITASDQSPNSRGEASTNFPFDIPVFSFFDANGNPLEGYSAHSSGFTCPRGDMNCDQAVDISDVPAFTSALLQPSGFGLCGFPSADMNDDGLVDGRDIRPFVACVMGVGCL